MQHVVECLSRLCKGKKNLDLKVESAILIQYTFFSKSVTIFSRSTSCPFCLCAEQKEKKSTQPWFCKWETNKVTWTVPRNTSSANQQQGNQLHSNLCLFLHFCQLLLLFSSMTKGAIPQQYEMSILSEMLLCHIGLKMFHCPVTSLIDVDNPRGQQTHWILPYFSFGHLAKLLRLFPWQSASMTLGSNTSVGAQKVVVYLFGWNR